MFSQVSVCPEGRGVPGRRDGHCSGRYASYWNAFLLLPPANEVWGKVIFSVACVKNSVHSGGGVSHHALQVVSQQAWGVSRPSSRSEVEGSGWGGSPGPHPGENLQAHTGGGVSQHALRQTPPSMATPAGGTHPTGMHSC